MILLRPPSLDYLLGGLFSVVFLFLLVNSIMQSIGYDEILKYGELGVLLIILLVVIPGLLKRISELGKINQENANNSYNTIKEIVNVNAEASKTNTEFLQKIVKDAHNLTYNVVDQTSSLRESIEEQTKELEKLVDLIKQ